MSSRKVNVQSVRAGRRDDSPETSGRSAARPSAASAPRASVRASSSDSAAPGVASASRCSRRPGVAVPIDPHDVLLGPRRHVALEARVAHAPARPAHVVAEQGAEGALARLAPDEAVLRPEAARHLAHLGPGGGVHALRGQHRAGRRHCLGAAHLDRRRLAGSRGGVTPQAEPDHADGGDHGQDGQPGRLPHRRRRRLLDRVCRRRAPGGVPQRRRRLDPGPAAIPGAERHPERRQEDQPEDALIHPRARRRRHEQRDAEQHRVEREVHDDGRQQTEPQVQQAEEGRRDDQLDDPRVGRLRGIRGVAGPEDENLQDERPRDPGPATAEPVSDERGAGQRDRPEQALLPESRL